MEFHKSLAKYYHKWLRDSLDSVDYCLERKNKELADKYLESARKYFDVIINNWEEIEIENR